MRAMKKYALISLSVLSLVFAQSASALYFRYEGGNSGGSYSSGYSGSSNYSSSYALSQTLTASCAPMQTSARVGEGITWYASAGGGTGSYNFYWNGTDGLVGNQSNIQHAYGTPGEKFATVTVYSGGQTLTAGCTSSVSIFTISPAPVAVASVKKVAAVTVKQPVKIASAPCDTLAATTTGKSNLVAGAFNTGIESPLLLVLLALGAILLAIWLAKRKERQERAPQTAH